MKILLMLKGGNAALQKAMDGIEVCYPKKKKKKTKNPQSNNEG